MSKMSRNKGASAEREVARILSAELSLTVRRNLQQFAEGGHDLRGLPVALEVKRVERLRIGEWWRQACEQAERVEKPPALAYRQSRQAWQFVVPAFCLPDFRDSAGFRPENWMLDFGHTAILQLDGFITLIREMMATEYLAKYREGGNYGN